MPPATKEEWNMEHVQTLEKAPAANRKYKDTVFRMLFSDRENLPLRDLFYISMEYQKCVTNKSLYSTHLQKIPAPKFMVFYNGTDEVEDRVELRLSSAYEHLAGEPDLELKVLMLNINEGHNEELMGQCRMLKEYALYVARVRRYTAEMSLNDAVTRAINECIREGILAEFLQKNRSEVKMVSILEYDKELEEKKLRKAEYEAGKNEGIAEAIRSMYANGCPAEDIARMLGKTIEAVSGILGNNV